MDLVKVHLDATLGDNLALEFARINPKDTLGGVELYVIPLEGIESFLEIFDMRFSVLAELVLENVIDQLLVHGASIFETKGHNLIAIYRIVSVEGSLVFISGIYLGLIICRIGIHEVEEDMTSCGIDKLINVG